MKKSGMSPRFKAGKGFAAVADRRYMLAGRRRKYFCDYLPDICNILRCFAQIFRGFP
jgi:hypothetical protein